MSTVDFVLAWTGENQIVSAEGVGRIVARPQIDPFAYATAQHTVVALSGIDSGIEILARQHGHRRVVLKFEIVVLIAAGGDHGFVIVNVDKSIACAIEADEPNDLIFGGVG